MTTSDRIRIQRESLGLTQEELAKKMGLKSKSSIAKIENPENKITLKTVEKVAEVLGCDVMYLMGWDKFNPDNSHTIHLLGKVAAGSPIFAEENIIGEINVPRNWSDKTEYFGLVIRGNSMDPQIKDTDIVVVHKQDTAESGEIVIATINGEDAVCKRLMKYGETILLRSFNSEYDDIDVTGMEDFKIWGKVVESRHKF